VAIQTAINGGIKRAPYTSMLAFRLETADPPSVIINVVDVAFPFGVSIIGLNLAMEPAGTPETLNEIALGNPFAVGVAVI
jgi:hypothetical protein